MFRFLSFGNLFAIGSLMLGISDLIGVLGGYLNHRRSLMNANGF